MPRPLLPRRPDGTGARRPGLRRYTRASEWIRPGTDVSAARTLSVRTCIGCRERSSPEGLLRVVLVDGTAVPDPQAIRPGRGAWLHPGCLEAAERRKAFTRALRASGAPDLTVLRATVERMSEAPQPLEMGIRG